MRRLAAVLALVVILGVVLGLAVTYWPGFKPVAEPGSGSMARVGLPLESMSDWVAAAELIVDGTVVDVQDVGLFTGWQEDGSVATVTPSGPVYDPLADDAIPLIETTVQIDAVYKDTSAGILPGQTILLRLPSHEVSPYFVGISPAGLSVVEDPYDSIGMASGTVGTSFLYALAPNPDGTSWGVEYKARGVLSMTGPEMMASGCPPSKLNFTDNVTPAAFMAEMMDVIENE